MHERFCDVVCIFWNICDRKTLLCSRITENEIHTVCIGRHSGKVSIGGEQSAESRTHQIEIQLLSACIGSDIRRNIGFAKENGPFFMNVGIGRAVNKLDAVKTRCIVYLFGFVISAVN